MATFSFLSLSGSNSTLFRLPFLFVLLLTFCFSCQSPDNAAVAGTAAEALPAEPAIDSVRLAARRPAPEFYILTPDNYKNRVYLCDDIYSDVFHNKYDCETLANCQETKRNVTLVSAIRDFGRYNCENCSAELAEIFDQEMVR